MNSPEQLGLIVERVHIQGLSSIPGFTIITDDYLNCEEHLDYIIADIPTGDLAHSIEVQVTMQVASLHKFMHFLKTRERNRVATSVYLVVPARNRVSASIEVMRRFAEEMRFVALPARQVTVILIGEQGIPQRMTSDEYTDHLHRLHESCEKVTGTIACVYPHGIEVNLPDGALVRVPAREFRGNILNKAFKRYHKGAMELIGLPVVVGITKIGKAQHMAYALINGDDLPRAQRANYRKNAVSTKGVYARQRRLMLAEMRQKALAVSMD